MARSGPLAPLAPSPPSDTLAWREEEIACAVGVPNRRDASARALNLDPIPTDPMLLSSRFPWSLTTDRVGGAPNRHAPRRFGALAWRGIGEAAE